jgi:hypothetical protein
MTAPASTTKSAGRFADTHGWALFCFSVVVLKFLLFAIDPLPKFVMGDSRSYIWTALTGWIPEDRSYFYGYIIRWTSVWPESLTGLVAFQVCLSAITCIVLAAICRFILKLPACWSYVFGFLCAIDPLQLLWERYVMTETISLCLYAFVIYHSFLYLRDRRLRDLTLLQAFSVVLIGFRISYLLLVEVNAVILPLIAFAPGILKRLRGRSTDDASRWSALRVCGGHVLVSVMLMLTLHQGYKLANGRVSHREPAYLYTTGTTILAFWAPVLQPEDAADPRLADLIRQGDEFGLRNPAMRNSQNFAPGYLLDRLAKIEPDPSKANTIARRTARRALWRDPLGILGLPWATYKDYWILPALKEFAERDFSFWNPPDADLVALLASRFHLSYNAANPTKSTAQWYYIAAWPYYFLVLLAPLLSGLAILLKAGRPYAIVLFVHSSIMMGMSMTFGSETLRLLQPISFMTILVLALGARAALRPVRTNEDENVLNEELSAVQSQPTLRSDLDSLAGPAIIPT